MVVRHMVMTKRGWPPNDFERKVVQDEYRTRTQCAWALLLAVKELYPKEFAPLERLGNTLQSETVDDDVGDAAEINNKAEERLTAGIAEWAMGHGISCEAVEEAARRYATGEGAWAGVVLETIPSITPRPREETRNEFVKRAGKHYDLVKEQLITAGASFGPVVRASTDQIKCVAAHYVGKCPFEELSERHEHFGVASKSPKTIAEETRHVAALIGLPQWKQPGPRPGRRSVKQRTSQK